MVAPSLFLSCLAAAKISSFVIVVVVGKSCASMRAFNFSNASASNSPMFYSTLRHEDHANCYGITMVHFKVARLSMP